MLGGSRWLLRHSYQSPDKLKPPINLLQLPTIRYLYGNAACRAHAVGFKRDVGNAGLLRPGSSRQHIADELHPVETNDFKNGLSVDGYECGGVH